MFGWLFPPKCPLDADSEAWVNERMQWLVETFGPRVLDDDPLLPIPTHIPEPFDGTEANLRRVLDRVLDHIGLDRDRVSLHIYDEADPKRELMRGAGLEGSWQSSGSAGHYYETSGADGRPFAIGIERKTTLSATGTVSTFAHEAMHVLLLGHAYVDHDEPDHEPLTDLATVYFGMGVFTANGLIHEDQWQSASMSGWSTGRRGYLSFPILGYALAHYARLRGESKPDWAQHLRPDARSAFDRARRYLHHRRASAVTRFWPTRDR